MTARRSDRALAVVLLVVLGAVFIAAGIIGTLVTQSVRAQEAFDAAAQEWTFAASAADDAAVELEAAGVEAQEAAGAASALVAVIDTEMMDDPDAATLLQASLDDVVAVGAITVVSPGEVTRAAAPAPAPRSEPVSPESTEDRLAAADALRAEAASLDAEAAQVMAEATATADATDDLVAATDAVLDTAAAKGATLANPGSASTASMDALAVAVAALADPAAGSPAERMQAYQDAWKSVEKSHQDAETVARGGGGGGDDGVQPTYIDGILIANKTYALPSWYGNGLTAETTSGFEQMRAEAAAQGLTLYISSGFRSYASQTAIYNRFVAAEGVAGADAHSARPGHSEHQTGLAIDLNTISEAFGYTPEGQWVAANAHRFGFIVRYPQGKQAITGYIWEPWHLRYIGVDNATAVYNSGLSLEEYLGITSVYG